MKTIKENLSILVNLNIADLISISAIIPIIIGYYFILEEKPNQAIIAIAVAFILDSLDGYIARKLKISSEFGKQLDSFVDTLNYLAFTSIFIINFLNFNKIIIFLSVFLMLATGVLRLVRFNIVGLVKNNDNQYYTGAAVPFTQLSIIILFLISSLFLFKIIYLTPLIIFIMSFLMISNIKFKKPKNYLIWYIIILAIICLALINLKT